MSVNKRKEFQKQEIVYNPREDDLVGPALPPTSILQGQDSSSEEEDQDILQNDPMYQQSQQTSLNIQQTVNKVTALQNTQIIDSLNQTECQKKFRQKKLNAEKLLERKIDDSSSEEDDDEAMKNDPMYQEIMKDKIQLNKKKELIDNHKNQSGQEQLENIQEIKQEFEASVLKKKIPYDEEVVLSGHQKLITALEFEKAGTRLLSGSYDYKMRIWQFNGMDKSMNAYRLVEPMPGYPIKNLSYSCNGEHILVIGGSPQFQLLKNDGIKWYISVKGDMYISDMAKTYGHVSEINDGLWHPNKPNIFATCSNDCSIRIWDTKKKLWGIQQQLTFDKIIKCTDQRGQKVIVNSLCYSNDGTILFAGCLDGSIQGFNEKTGYHRPYLLVRNAHTLNEPINCIKCFQDPNKIVSRSLDGTLKIWDLKKFKKPIIAHYNLDTYLPGSKIAISPCDQIIVTGSTSGQQEREKVSYLHFFDANSHNQIDKIAVGNKYITDIKWNPRINQIVYGIGNEVRLLYDQQLSSKGALLFVKKEQRKKKIEDLYVNERPVIAPNALRMFKEHTTIKQVKKKEQEEREKLLPKQPIDYGSGKQGNIRGANSLTTFMMKQVNQLPGNREDAQQALIKHAEAAKENPVYFKSYQIFDNKPKFDEDAFQEEEQEYLSTIQNICAHCGLKICTCATRTKFEDKKLFDDKKFDE